MDNNKDFIIAAEVELSSQAKKMGLDFFKPSDYALGWRHCIDWIQKYEAALQSVTIIEQKETEAIENYKYLLRNFTDCPELIIENPSFVKGKKPSDADLEWAKNAIKKYEDGR